MPERRPPKLETLSSAVSSVGGFLHSQLDVVAEYTEQPGLSQLCGGELFAVLELTDSAVHGMYDVLVGVRDILECNNFNPMYTTLVYDGEFFFSFRECNWKLPLTSLSVAALCNGGVAGLSWAFFTSLSMAIFSMIMVTLRVAIHQY